MSLENVKRPITNKIISIFLLFIGLAFIVGSIYIYSHVRNLIKNGEVTNAIIVSIIEERKGEDETISVFIEYEIKGTKYFNELGSYTNKMFEGQNVTIRYLPNDPYDIIYAKNEFLSFGLTLSIGCSLIMIALVTFYYAFFKKQDFHEELPDGTSFLARNSKVQSFIFILPIFILIYQIYTTIANKESIIGLIVILLVMCILIYTSMHFYSLPKKAIEVINDIIIFYKKKKIITINIDDIKLIKINDSCGSFDVSIYINNKRKYSFHYLIQKSSYKKEQFIQFFEMKNIQVIRLGND